MGQKYAAYNAQNQVFAYYDSVISPVPANTNAIAITDVQWQSCLATPGTWTVANGGLVPPAGPTQAQTVATLSAAVSAALDAGAQKWGYDNIVSAASYATSTNAQYAADAKALIGWRDAVWSWAIPQFATVAAGTTAATFLASMPAQPAQTTV